MTTTKSEFLTLFGVKLICYFKKTYHFKVLVPIVKVKYSSVKKHGINFENISHY